MWNVHHGNCFHSDLNWQGVAVLKDLEASMSSHYHISLIRLMMEK